MHQHQLHSDIFYLTKRIDSVYLHSPSYILHLYKNIVSKENLTIHERHSEQCFSFIDSCKKKYPIHSQKSTMKCFGIMSHPPSPSTVLVLHDSSDRAKGKLREVRLHAWWVTELYGLKTRVCYLYFPLEHGLSEEICTSFISHALLAFVWKHAADSIYIAANQQRISALCSK